MANQSQKYSIKWTPKSLETFEDISFQLIERWGNKTAISFYEKVGLCLKQIQVNPKLNAISKKSNLHKCIVHRNVSLIYRINNYTVELIVFVDNRGNHNF